MKKKPRDEPQTLPGKPAPDEPLIGFPTETNASTYTTEKWEAVGYQMNAFFGRAREQNPGLEKDAPIVRTLAIGERVRSGGRKGGNRTKANREWSPERIRAEMIRLHEQHPDRRYANLVRNLYYQQNNGPSRSAVYAATRNLRVEMSK